MKKTVATMLCSVMAVAMLGACAGGGNTGTPEESQATEEAAVEETEEVTESAEETTETSEEPVEAEEDEIVELFFDPDVKEVDPEELAMFDNYIMYVFLSEVDECEHPVGDYQMNELADFGHSFELATEDGTETDVIDIYLYPEPLTEAEGSPEKQKVIFILPGRDYLAAVEFMPLIYNKTKKCIVGYKLKEGEYVFLEYYLRTDGVNFLKPVEVDPSLYGF